MPGWVKVKEGLKHRIASDVVLEGGAEHLASDVELDAFGDKFDVLAREVDPGIPSKIATAVATDSVGVEIVEIVNATNGARELAAEHGLVLSTVEGSGENGRITVKDVRKALDD